MAVLARRLLDRFSQTEIASVAGFFQRGTFLGRYEVEVIFPLFFPGKQSAMRFLFDTDFLNENKLFVLLNEYAIDSSLSDLSERISVLTSEPLRSIIINKNWHPEGDSYLLLGTGDLIYFVSYEASKSVIQNQIQKREITLDDLIRSAKKNMRYVGDPSESAIVIVSREYYSRLSNRAVIREIGEARDDYPVMQPNSDGDPSLSRSSVSVPHSLTRSRGNLEMEEEMQERKESEQSVSATAVVLYRGGSDRYLQPVSSELDRTRGYARFFRDRNAPPDIYTCIRNNQYARVVLDNSRLRSQMFHGIDSANQLIHLTNIMEANRYDYHLVILCQRLIEDIKHPRDLARCCIIQ